MTRDECEYFLFQQSLFRLFRRISKIPTNIVAGKSPQLEAVFLRHAIECKIVPPVVNLRTLCDW